MQLRIDTKLFKPGQHFIFALKVNKSADRSLTNSVGQYLVTGKVIPCRFVPAPPPPPLPPELTESGTKVIRSQPSIMIP
ncbi:hypothetical protein [Actinomadura alba]|uniref:hypothetical protein n=1 Tax=Actinomadura alba TaxID=406431 RepID=UPI0031D173DC